MGAVVFGLEIGYWSQLSIMSSFQKVMTGNALKPLSADELSWLSSSYLLVAGFFALPFVSSLFTDGLGRRWTIIIAGLVFAVSQTLQCAAVNPAMMWAGRTLIGVPVAFCVTTVPMYLSEISPREIRGFLGGMFQFTLCFFMVISALIAWQISVHCHDSHGFRWAIVYHIPVGLATSILMYLSVESPRYLLLKGRTEEAEATMYKLRTGAPQAAIAEEWRLMQEDVEAEKALGESTYKGLFTGFPLRIMIVTVLVQGLQQFSGQNAINNFGPGMYSATGQDGVMWDVIGKAAQWAMTIPSALLVDKAGRRTFLIGGAGLACAIMCVMGILALTSMHRPGMCIRADTCTPGVGFCTSEGTYDGVFTSVADLHAAVGQNATYVNSDTMRLDCLYTGNGAPTAENGGMTHVSDGVAWTIVLCITLYGALFGLTLGPIGWTYNAEIAPLKYRAKILGMAAASNLFCNFIINHFSAGWMKNLGFPSFFIYGGCMAFATLMFWWLPETAGVTLEDVTERFERKFRCQYLENTDDVKPKEMSGEF